MSNNTEEQSQDCYLSLHNNNHIDKIFEKINEATNVALICHDTPDPDTISPAFALQEYCNNRNINSKIFYGGNIARLQNKALVNVLSINMIKFSDLLKSEDGSVRALNYPTEYISNNFDLIIFLDTSQYGGIGNVQQITNIPDIIIDHHCHDSDRNNHDNVMTMNHRCGATASIISYMFMKKDIAFSQEVATALFIGLMSDTNNMTCQIVTDLDREANNYLLRFIDFAIYNRIMNYETPLELLNIRKIAYGEYLYRQANLVITGVGYLKPEFKDLTAVIADEIIRSEGIQKVITIGVLEERNGTKVVTSSVRTLADTVNTDAFCKHIFGQKYAGAKQGSGGAYVPITGLAPNLLKTNREKFFEMTYEYYKNRIIEEHTSV